MRNKIVIYCISIMLFLFIAVGCDLVPGLERAIYESFGALKMLIYVLYVAGGELEMEFEDPETGATQNRRTSGDSYGRPDGKSEIDIPLVSLVPGGKMAQGEIDWIENNGDTVYYKVIGYFKHGKRHGWQEYFYPDGTLYDRVYYANGKRSDPPENDEADASNVHNLSSTASEVISFRILQEAYPWFLFKMEAYGFEPDLIEDFMAALQSRIVFHAPWSESEFTPAFRESVEDIRESDTLLVRHYEFIAGIESMLHIRSFELRLAVIDRCLGNGEPTYEILQEHYTDFLEKLLAILDEEAIRVFTDDLDNRIDSEGPIDLEDPAHIEIIDERILNAINEMFESSAHLATLLVIQHMVTEMAFGVNPIHEALKSAYFVTSVNDNGTNNLQAPVRITLEQNYPNPFNPTTQLRYSIPEQSQVQLIIYDAVGKEVAVLVDKLKSSGTYDVTFDASHLSSGVYLYQLQAGDYVKTKRLVLVK